MRGWLGHDCLSGRGMGFVKRGDCGFLIRIGILKLRGGFLIVCSDFRVYLILECLIYP